MNYLLGLDLGTTYFKASVVDSNGNTAGLARERTPAVTSALLNKKGCWIEPAAFWKTLHRIIAKALREASTGIEKVKGISYASQANSFILLDKNYTPVTPLILWPDKRAAEPDDRVYQLWQRPDFITTTGLGFQSNIFAIVKIGWIRKHQPDLWERTRYIMSISDFLSFGLTGNRVGDWGTASLLGLHDVHQRRWWPAALTMLEIDQEMISTPRLICTPLGKTLGRISELPLLPKGTPLFAGSLDHHAAAIGSGLGAAAEVCDSCGTVSACISLTSSFSPKEGVCFGPHDSKETWFALTFDNQGLPGSNTLLADISRTLLKTLLGEKTPQRVLAAGGGARISKLLQQKANQTGSIYITSRQEEPGSYGAAMIAATGLGWFDNLREASRGWMEEGETIVPAGHDSV